MITDYQQLELENMIMLILFIILNVLFLYPSKHLFAFINESVFFLFFPFNEYTKLIKLLGLLIYLSCLNPKPCK